MPLHPSLRVVAALALTLPALSLAQQNTGIVSGHVVCADTQRPARFPTVLLVGVPTTAPTATPNPNASQAEQMAAMRSSMNRMKMVQTQTDIDGAFAAAGANPGDYYVFASVPGYIQPTNLVQAAIAAGADPAKSLPGVPQVHVVADKTSQADLSVERGAAISGHTLWDDGTPVTRAMVAIVPAGEKPKDLPPEFTMLAVTSAMGGGGLFTFTDDRGEFRAAGLAPGDYVVKAVLTTKSSFAMQGGAMNLDGALAAQTLTVFAPAAFHKKDAKAVTVKAGEERSDTDIAFNLAGLETVSGTVASAEDHHPINSGSIKLEDSTDKDFTRTGAVDAAGNFSLTFVPSGTYTLSVTGASDEAASTKKPTGLITFNQTETLRSYEDATKTIVVLGSALPGQNFELTPSAKTLKKQDMNQFLISPPPPPPPPPNE